MPHPVLPHLHHELRVHLDTEDLGESLPSRLQGPLRVRPLEAPQVAGGHHVGPLGGDNYWQDMKGGDTLISPFFWSATRKKKVASETILSQSS